MSGNHHEFPLPPDAEGRVRALLEGTLRLEDRRAAMDHLRACGPCRELYDGVASAEHALAGGSKGVLGPAALERVAARLDAERPAPRRARAGWLSWAATAAATCLLVLMVRTGLRPADDGFTARGGIPAEGIGIRLYLLDGPVRELREGDVVRRGQRLGASYSSGRFDELRWFVESAGGPAVTLPELGGDMALRGVVDEAVDASVEVDERFARGIVEVGAVFSGNPDGSPVEERRALRLTVEDAP